MEHLVHLTSWESGQECWVDPKTISLCERLEAFYESDSMPPVKVGRRTKLIVAGQIILVHETPAEIRKLAGFK